MKSVNENLIQVTCTACIRPDILDITFSSFNEKLLYQFKRKELFINIDPLGESQDQMDQMFIICKQYFDSVTINSPSTPDFPKAAKWVWQQVTADYFLHLEDDWLLNKNISKEKVLNELFSNELIATIRLNRETSIKNRILNKVSLNPIFIKTEFIRQALDIFNDSLDPEKQLSIPPLKNHLINWSHLAYGNQNGKYIEGAFVTDIGKYWRKSQGLIKNTSLNKSTWEQKNISYANILKSFIFYKTLKLRRLINHIR